MSEMLDELFDRGAKFLGCKYPIVGGAMSWVSERNLVGAISNAGGFGVIATGSMPPELLDEEIKATQAITSCNFGVNLIIMHPALEELIDVCVTNKVSHVILAGGMPKTSNIVHLKNHGIKVLSFAPSLIIAKRLLKFGVDGLIIEGMEAGGHIGPVSTSVLVQEIIPEISEVPVFVAGGIGRGEVMATYLEMGAAGCQLGTRFVCSSESIAHPRFKEVFINSNSRDATTSIQLDPEFPVIAVRALENKASRTFLEVQKEAINEYRAGKLSKMEAQLKIEHFWAGALRRAVIEGDTEYGSVMMGQSVGMVKKIEPVSEIIASLIAQAENYLSKKCLT